MTISIFDLFSIGIGPSSSHTVGPMKAAHTFATALKQQMISNVKRVQIELFGSLAFTGRGHGTDAAVLVGLEGFLPETVDPEMVKPRAQSIMKDKKLNLCGTQIISFEETQDLLFITKETLDFHSNAMRFSAYDQENLLYTKTFYSIGGGFIVEESEIVQGILAETNIDLPYPFHSAKTLLTLCESNQLSIKELMLRNETKWRPEAEVKEKLQHIATTMRTCIDKGCTSQEIYLPGQLKVKRRAPTLYQKLLSRSMPRSSDQMETMEWLNLYAIAVNEENAAGGRIVTAPTNGAAGIIPAVLHYYLTFYSTAKKDDAIDFLLTAGAIAILYKKGASISGAEVGCQGEVGAACSMAAGALTAVLGGSLLQIENAAEIAMEHHLGMTCDPIEGLVQIPCIERNAMGAVKAVNAARLALLGNGEHFVTLDKVIATMKQTGKDMLTIYKETSQGGLAVNLPEC